MKSPCLIHKDSQIHMSESFYAQAPSIFWSSYGLPANRVTMTVMIGVTP